jgi:hypothetical protein
MRGEREEEESKTNLRDLDLKMSLDLLNLDVSQCNNEENMSEKKEENRRQK